jgi:hypothetical protein
VYFEKKEVISSLETKGRLWQILSVKIKKKEKYQ